MKVGMVGAGNVGGGVIELLKRNSGLIETKAGEPVSLAGVAVRDVAKAKGKFGDEINWVTDWRTLTSDGEIDVIVEVMGGLDEAGECVMSAFDNGKAVVTANKALLAERGGDIFARTQDEGKTLKYEAAIAGAIPAVKVVSESLAANRIESVVGIVNGTCNYILSSMEKGHGGLDECLRKAQELGFAEADPGLDIDGVDAGHKIALLGRLAMDAPLEFDKVTIKGISGIDEKDISYAEEMGYRIRLLAIAKRDDNGGIELMVSPTLLPLDHIMAKVDGNMNAVLIVSDAAGETLCYGAGAGPLPTASAIVSDLIEIARGGGGMPDKSRAKTHIVPAADIRAHSFYLRIRVQDRPGVLAQVSGILADEDVSIDSVVQRESSGDAAVDLMMILHRNRFGRVLDCVRRIEDLDQVLGKAKLYPVETFA